MQFKGSFLLIDFRVGEEGGQAEAEAETETSFCRST